MYMYSVLKYYTLVLRMLLVWLRRFSFFWWGGQYFNRGYNIIGIVNLNPQTPSFCVSV